MPRHSRRLKPSPVPLRLLLLLFPLFLLLLLLFVLPLLVRAPPAPLPPPSFTNHVAAAAVSNLLYPPELLRPTTRFPPHEDVSNYYHLIVHAHLPPVFASRLGPTGRSKLLRRLTVNSNGRLLWPYLPRLLLVDLQNGLGNRLRALASALEFAYHSKRVLVILWAPDAHLNATMPDLFDRRLLDALIVIDRPVAWPIRPHDVYTPLAPSLPLPHMSDHFSYFSLMPRDNGYRPATARITAAVGKHVYVKTAYLLSSAWTDDRLVNPFVQALRPAPRVLALVAGVERRAGGARALRRMVGVHIRGRAIVADNDAVDHECEYSIAGARTTDAWRAMSTARQFVPEMWRVRRRWGAIVRRSYGLRGDAQTGRRPRFYVAADSVQTTRALQREFGGKAVLSLERQCDDRGAACIVYAFADMVVLSRTGMLLASGWSSFSEVVGRLRVRLKGMDPSANQGFMIRTSGVDFGCKGRWKRAWERVWRWGRPWAASVSQEERMELCRRRGKAHR